MGPRPSPSRAGTDLKEGKREGNLEERRKKEKAKGRKRKREEKDEEKKRSKGLFVEGEACKKAVESVTTGFSFAFTIYFRQIYLKLR